METPLKISFQGGDVLAQCRLGDVQDVGGQRDAAHVDDLHEIFEAPETHGMVSFLSRDASKPRAMQEPVLTLPIRSFNGRRRNPSLPGQDPCLGWSAFHRGMPQGHP